MSINDSNIRALVADKTIRHFLVKLADRAGYNTGILSNYTGHGRYQPSSVRADHDSLAWAYVHSIGAMGFAQENAPFFNETAPLPLVRLVDVIASNVNVRDARSKFARCQYVRVKTPELRALLLQFAEYIGWDCSAVNGWAAKESLGRVAIAPVAYVEQGVFGFATENSKLVERGECFDIFSLFHFLSQGVRRFKPVLASDAVSKIAKRRSQIVADILRRKQEPVFNRTLPAEELSALFDSIFHPVQPASKTEVDSQVKCPTSVTALTTATHDATAVPPYSLNQGVGQWKPALGKAAPSFNPGSFEDACKSAGLIKPTTSIIPTPSGNILPPPDRITGYVFPNGNVRIRVNGKPLRIISRANFRALVVRWLAVELSLRRE